jgi:tRNA(adenine34) deaminase
MELFSDAYFMQKALELAQQAGDEDEVPIGAVVVHERRIVGKGYNQTERLKDVTAHAEMLAITAAAQCLDTKFLDECTLYVTIEPCSMCAGAISWARLGKIVYGAGEPKFGYQSKTPAAIGAKTEVVGGILEEECRGIMQAFFKAKR